MTHSGKVLDTVGDFDIIECEVCGFKHVSPYPSEEELVKFYQNEFYQTAKPNYIKEMEEDKEWWNLIYDDRYDRLELYLSKKFRTLLDIGCGPGFFMMRGKERGWDATGVEPSSHAQGYALGKGLEVYEKVGDILTRDTFDVVNMSEVLEHVTNPKETLHDAHDCLNEHGLICISCPNDYSKIQNALVEEGYRKYWLAPPQHLNYFDFKSLKKLLEQTGFDVLYKSATFPMEWFLAMGFDYVKDPVQGRECHGLRKDLDLFLNGHGMNGFRRSFYDLCARHGMGRDMVMIARKV